MNRRQFLGASAAAFLSHPAAAATSKRSLQIPDVNRLLEVMRVPGLAARGIVRGTPVRIFAGVREAGKPERVEAATRFSAASLSKPVFAMAVRRLVRAGKLAWRTPLQSYADLGLTGTAAKLTAEHVLSHSSGLVNWRFDRSHGLEAAFEPGTSWRYSGEGYVLLQRVVEAVTGEPLGRHLNAMVRSIGMSRSTFTWSPALLEDSTSYHDGQGRLLERSSTFYERNAFDLAAKAGGTTDALTFDQMIAAAKQHDRLPLPIAVVPNAAGSLWTTADDYFTFLELSLADRAAHPDEYAPRVRVNPAISWTLSWGVDASVEPHLYFHHGDGAGVKNITVWQPAARTALAIFTNGDHGAAPYRWLLRQLLGSDPLALDWF